MDYFAKSAVIGENRDRFAVEKSFNINRLPMHHLLQQQLQMLGLDAGDMPESQEQWLGLLERISLSYRAADNDRHVLEQSIEIAEQKLGESEQPSTLSSPDAPFVEASAMFDAVLFDAWVLLDASGFIREHHGVESIVDVAIEDCDLDGFHLMDLFSSEAVVQIEDALKLIMGSSSVLTLTVPRFTKADPERWEIRLKAVAAQSRIAMLIREAALPHKSDADNERELIGSLVQSSSEGMLLLNANREVLIANPAFELMTGVKAASMRSIADFEFYGIDDKALGEEIWQKVYYHDTWCGEIVVTLPDDSKRPVWLTIDTAKADDGTIRHYLALLRDISQIKKSQEQIEHFAAHDQLTGLPNRTSFYTHLNSAIERSKRSGKTGALFFLDLDNFKSINDTLGHPVGDALLLGMAVRLKQFFRRNEMVARLGGDEFTLVVENLERAEEAAIVAQRLLREFSKPFDVGEHKLDASCSIGISMFPNDGESAEQLVKQADTAMYSAKESGRNTFKFYTSQLTHKAVKLFNIETQLRRAIERDELHLHYQPQIDMKRRTVTGAEVLLRWENETHGAMSPEVFIPVAEASGLINDIGFWVIEQVCQQIKIWEMASPLDCLLSVNVSRKQLVQPAFAKNFKAILDNVGITGERLELEVTESAIASSEKIAIGNLRALREMGCKIAIDDFGTGYSSLASLQKFPLDRLKIDKSFVKDLEVDGNSVSIVEAVIALSKSLKLGVIAEGVETAKQAKELMKRGCNHAQGYYYGRPVSASKFRSLITRKQAIS